MHERLTLGYIIIDNFVSGSSFENRPIFSSFLRQPTYNSVVVDNCRAIEKSVMRAQPYRTHGRKAAIYKSDIRTSRRTRCLFPYKIYKSNKILTSRLTYRQLDNTYSLVSKCGKLFEISLANIYTNTNENEKLFAYVINTYKQTHTHIPKYIKYECIQYIYML